MDMGNSPQKCIKRYRFVKLNRIDLEKIIGIFQEVYPRTTFYFDWESNSFEHEEEKVEIPDKCSSIQFTGYDPDKMSDKSRLCLRLSSQENSIELTYLDEQERSTFEKIHGIVEKGVVKFDSEPSEKTYPPIKLYKEDIDELLNIITKGTDRSSIAVGYHTLNLSDEGINSIDDLDFNRNIPLDRLCFSGYIAPDSENNYYAFGPEEDIRVVLSRHEASITLSNRKNIKLLGIQSAVEQVLRRQKRPILSLISIPIKPMILISLIFPIVIFIRGIVNPAILFFSFWTPFWILFTVGTFAPKTKINFTKKPESAFEYIRANRNRILETIIVGVCCAVAGAVVSGLF